MRYNFTLTSPSSSLRKALSLFAELTAFRNRFGQPHSTMVWISSLGKDLHHKNSKVWNSKRSIWCASTIMFMK